MDAQTLETRPQKPQGFDRNLKVLLVGESGQGSSYLANRLRLGGWQCEFATSYEGMLVLLKDEDIYLVLCPLRLNRRSLLPLMDLLEASRISLFYSLQTEQSCWWLPGLRHGRKCFGSGAVLPSEFISVLDEVVEQIVQVHRHTSAKPFK
jgi:hypothetical protein